MASRARADRSAVLASAGRVATASALLRSGRVGDGDGPVRVEGLGADEGVDDALVLELQGVVVLNPPQREAVLRDRGREGGALGLLARPGDVREGVAVVGDGLRQARVGHDREAEEATEGGLAQDA